MPIDWDMIARAFRLPLKAEFRTMALAFERMEKWLETRVPYFEGLEFASRGIPSLYFRGEDITVVVGAHQYGALAGEPSFMDSLRAGGSELVRGIAYIRTAVVEAQVLPDLLETVARVAEAVLESVTRFATPTAAMFDPRLRRASDLFGLAGLAFRATISSLGQIKQAGLDAAALKKAFGGTGGAAGAAGAGGRALAPTLGETLDEFSRMIMGGILGLAILPELVGVVLSALDLRVRHTLLSVFDGVERSVFELRASVFQTMYGDLPAMADWALTVALLLQDLVVTNLTFLTGFGTLYLLQLTVAMVGFAQQFQQFMAFWTIAVKDLIDGFNSIMRYNLTPWIVRLMGGVVGVFGKALDAIGVLPELTLEGLISGGANAARVVMREALRRALDVAEAPGKVPLVGRLVPSSVKRTLAQVRSLVEALLQAPKTIPAETSGPGLVGRFPDLHQPLADALTTLDTLVADLGTELRANIADAFGSGKITVDRLHQSFRDTQLQVTLLGSVKGYRAMNEQASALAHQAFGTQADALRARQGAPDPFADAFSAWLAKDAFGLLATILPAYVAEMDRYVAAQKKQPDQPSAFVPPTSPHILIKREVRLTRVQMREMHLEADGALDASLAKAVADHFVGEVQQAFRSGNQRLGELHASAIAEAEKARAGKAPRRGRSRPARAGKAAKAGGR